MDDEQRDVRSCSSGGVSGPGELVVENMRGEDHVEEGCEEGDEGEIMVEVVGSDVFVDGVSGQRVSYLGSGEVGDLEDRAGKSGEETGAKGMDELGEKERNIVMASGKQLGKDEAVGKAGSDLVTSELLNCPAEDVGEGKVGAAEEKELVSSNDNAAGHEASNVADGVEVEPFEVSLNNKNEGPDNVQVGGIDGVVGESDLVNATEGGEVLASGSGEHGVDIENADAGGNSGIEAELVEKEVLATESKEENQGVLKESDVIKHVPTHGIDDASHASIDSSLDERLVSGAGETDMANQNHVLSTEPTQLADGGDIAEANETQVLHIEHQADTKEYQLNTTTSDVEMVQADDENAAVDASTENIQLSPKASCSKVETADVRVVENHGDVPVVNAEVGLDNAVKECGSIERKNQEGTVQMTESSNDGVDRLEGMDLMPTEVANAAAVSVINQTSILPEITEKAELDAPATHISLLDGGNIEKTWACDMVTSSDVVHKLREVEDNLNKTNGFYTVEGHTSETKLVHVEEEKEPDSKYHEGMEIDYMEAEIGTEEPAYETDKFKLSNEGTTKSASFVRMNQSGYLLPQVNEGHFAHSDLVWGKVRSHPWWPGQIFDPAHASENALKYYKKDSYLVAYFGDRTFAWNDESLLKPFRSHFSQIEKHSNSEAFQNAVDCALEEISRRVQLGLSCACVPQDAYSKIESQVVENAGICEESSTRYGVDKSTCAACFEPDKLLDYVRDLAPHASSGADRLDLVIAQAQLSAFCHFKGYRLPTEFPVPGELLENDADTEPIHDQMVSSQKHKHTPQDGTQSRKERSLMELMGEWEYSADVEDDSVVEDLGKSVLLSPGKKRKALDPLADGSDKRLTTSAAKLSASTSQTPKPSFKIGECIRRVASQLTGSTSLVKGNNDETALDGSPKIYEHPERRGVVLSAESFSLNEMLSQLQLLAQDPKKGNNFQYNIRTFFLGFRSSIALERRGRKKRADPTVGGSGEEYEFYDVNDSYWTDRIVQNYSGEQLLQNSENGTENLQLVSFSSEKSVKPGRRSRKRYSTGSYPMTATESDEDVKRRKQESSPAELILNFAERSCVPSEINLNKMFRRFGSLMESETEVDHEAGRAKVIFKRGSDAEVALNSAEKFNIFGAVLVNYQIGYSPLISVKILPVAIPQCHEDETVMQ